MSETCWSDNDETDDPVTMSQLNEKLDEVLEPVQEMVQKLCDIERTVDVLNERLKEIEKIVKQNFYKKVRS